MNDKDICGFCGKARKDVKHMVAGQKGAICDVCAKRAALLLKGGSGENGVIPMRSKPGAA